MSEPTKRYGYLITYEEAPYADQELATDARPDGINFRYPKSFPLVFSFPPVAEQSDGTTATSPLSANRDLIQPLLDQHNRSANSQRFTAIYEEEFTHIVPASRSVNGQAIAFQPMLSTTVSFTAEENRCIDAFQNLLAQVSRARGIDEWESAQVPQPALINGGATQH